MYPIHVGNLAPQRIGGGLDDLRGAIGGRLSRVARRSRCRSPVCGDPSPPREQHASRSIRDASRSAELRDFALPKRLWRTLEGHPDPPGFTVTSSQCRASLPGYGAVEIRSPVVTSPDPVRSTCTRIEQRTRSSTSGTIMANGAHGSATDFEIPQMLVLSRRGDHVTRPGFGRVDARTLRHQRAAPLTEDGRWTSFGWISG
jgi:hypothetical protein